MLHKIRKAADSPVFKLFLGILVVSFALGVANFIKDGGKESLVTFSGIDSISREELAAEKAMELKRIQQNEGVTYSEEQIAEMGIDNMILSRMIQGRLLSFLAKTYDIDFSDSVIADVIKRLPVFRDDNNSFNVDRFKAYLRINNMSEEQYADQVYDYIASNMIMSSFIGNSHISKLRVENIINYMSEIRSVDIASVSLKNPQTVDSAKINDADLLAFYEENKEDFKTPEIRDICYIKIDPEFVKAKIKITDGEINQFYTDNKEDFAGKKLAAVKGEIKDRIYKQKIDQQVVDLSKSLEDEVAGGSTLEEIAAKYGLKNICEKNLSYNNIETRADGLFANFITQLSAMEDKEVSYPLDLPENKGIALFEIAKLIPEKIKDFAEVKNEVATRYHNFMHRQNTLKKLQDLSSNMSSAEFSKSASSAGMSVAMNKSYIRADLAENNKESPEMMVAMFSTAPDKVTGPFIWEDRAYIFVVRKIGYDTATVKKLTKSASDNIANKMRDGIIEELLSYAQRESKMKVKEGLGK